MTEGALYAILCIDGCHPSRDVPVDLPETRSVGGFSAFWGPLPLLRKQSIKKGVLSPVGIIRLH